MGGRNIKDGRIRITDKDSRIDDAPLESFRRAVARPGDIIVSTLFDARKLCIYRDSDPPAVVNNSCAIIRAPKTNDYILSYLRTRKGEEQFLREAERLTGGTTIPRLSTSALANIQIPILPLLDLQKLGDSHIEKSSNDELLTLQAELESKDGRIADLERKLSGLLAKDAENEKLRAEVGQLTAYYEDRLQKIAAQRSTNDLIRKIAHGETRQLEFKSTLRWSIKANRDDPNMETAVLKTIAAFCNTDGGELLIGVSDAKEILGLALDHFQDSDKFLLHLRNLIVVDFLPAWFRMFITRSFSWKVRISVMCYVRSTRAAFGLRQTKVKSFM